jgi:N-glycosylase/DNA lyase
LVRKLVEVRRDREYYRDTKIHPIDPKSDRFLRFEGIRDCQEYQHILEDLKTYVYRTPFMDVLVDVRQIREACESLEDSSIEDFEVLAERLETLYADLALLPLPKELYSRVEVEVKSVKEAVALTL